MQAVAFEAQLLGFSVPSVLVLVEVVFRVVADTWEVRMGEKEADRAFVSSKLKDR